MTRPVPKGVRSRRSANLGDLPRPARRKNDTSGAPADRMLRPRTKGSGPDRLPARQKARARLFFHAPRSGAKKSGQGQNKHALKKVEMQTRLPIKERRSLDQTINLRNAPCPGDEQCFNALGGCDLLRACGQAPCDRSTLTFFCGSHAPSSAAAFWADMF